MRLEIRSKDKYTDRERIQDARVRKKERIRDSRVREKERIRDSRVSERVSE